MGRIECLQRLFKSSERFGAGRLDVRLDLLHLFLVERRGRREVTFCDFSAQHWTHIRTTNPIENTFATVRLRHDKTKGNGTRKACLAMVFKLAAAAQKRWRKLKDYTLLTDVITDVRFVDGEKHKAA